MGYLVSKYAKNDSLYPKDPKKRGLVDQMLYFDAGDLYENMLMCYVRILEYFYQKFYFCSNEATRVFSFQWCLQRIMWYTKKNNKP